MLLLTLVLSACTPRQSVPDAAQLRNMAESFLGQLRLPVDMVAVEAPVLISAHEHTDTAGRILKLTLDLRYRLLVSGVDLDSARVSRAQGMNVPGAVFALQNDIQRMVGDPSHSIYAAHAGDVLVYKATVDLRRGHAGHWHVIAGEVARLPRIEQAAPPGRSAPAPTSSVPTATENAAAAPTLFAPAAAPPPPPVQELSLSYADISLLQPLVQTVPSAPPQAFDQRDTPMCRVMARPPSDSNAQAAVNAGWLVWRARVVDGPTQVLQLAAGVSGQCIPEGLADLVVHNGQILTLIRSGATVQFMGPSLRDQGRALHLAIDRYAPEDAHCCPSIHQSIDFAVGIHGLSISRIQDNAPAVSSAATMATPQAATYSHDAPSFDCARATTPVEHAICDNPTLSRLDGRMGKLYAQRLATDPGERRRQIDWIRARDATCRADVTCLIAAEHARMQALQQPGPTD